VLAGLYPALYMSRFQPVRILKGIAISRGRTYTVRKVLVGAQFAISIFLVISVLLLNRQVNFMKKKDIGFDPENMITLGRLSPAIQNSYPTIAAELLQHPSVIGVTASSATPGEPRNVLTVHRRGEDSRTSILISGNFVQDNYVDTYGMQIVAGENFHNSMRSDFIPVIINEAAVRQLNLEDPVGQEVFIEKDPVRIIGVVKDYNFMSMHHTIEPLMLIYAKNYIRRISIRIAPHDINQTMQYIRERLTEADANIYFEPDFVSHTFSGMYQKEERLNQLTTAAAVLAIIISFMGLYALTSFSIMKRIKEIGIRKTLGAPVTSILLLLFRDLRNWILLGNLVAWPVAFYVVSLWLEYFAFRIHIWDYWYLFVLAGILAAMVGAVATFMHAWGCLKVNPVNSLRAD
jgi:putative ABC transport system permease protein